MENVTKLKPAPKPKCAWCGKRFKGNAVGRRAIYCSASCRQRSYEKRKWTPYNEMDALKLDLIPNAVLRRLGEDTRRWHMVELVMNGTVPLNETNQIAGILNAAKAPERMPLLRRIEAACQRRADDKALATIARWRLLRQQPSQAEN